MKLIVGLGNPGKEYALTRHNAGFMVVDRLAGSLGAAIDKKMFKALVGQGLISGHKVIMAKPQTYMNLSGEAVASILNWHKLKASDLMVIYDDLDLPPGRLRLRPGGGAGGHKGVQSIIQQLDTDKFARIRVGIGRPDDPGYDTADFVLGRFNSQEAELIDKALTDAVEALRCIIGEGLDNAMNQYNRK